MARRIGIIALIIVMSYGLSRVYFRLTDDFRLANIKYEMPYHPEWEIAPHAPQEQQKLDGILNQTFYYIGKGAQSYAFVSEDQKYVIKFFKFKHRYQKLTIRMLPSIPPFKEYKLKNAAKKQRKLLTPFKGYKLAYDLHKEGSGLVTIHLNPTTHLNKTVKVRDKIGIKRYIELDPHVFIIQEKATVTAHLFHQHLKKGDIQTTKHWIRKIIDHHVEEYQKGLYDKDHSVMKNMGFVADRPIRIDVGMFQYDERMKQPEAQKEDLKIITTTIEKWFQQHYPQYHDEIARDIHLKVNEIFG